MAFYTADWVRKLVKEDHKALQTYLSKKDNDFRGYIDSTLPFTLYLDIDQIRRDILKPNSKFIENLANAMPGVDAQLVLDTLDKAYQKTINYYIDTYQEITSEELSAKLSRLQAAVDSGSIKDTITTEFKKTVVIKNISKRNKSVLIMSPKFTTIQSKFGSVVKENFDLSKFSDLIDDSLDDSPRNLIKKYLDKNFVVLQNLGHVEVDVLSSVEGSTEVKRGLVSPRLLQALIEWPKGSKPDLLARKFSKETGQAETRIKVRKKFTSSKLVLELLIEAGMMIGAVESQEENLRKAPKEKAFLIGQNLTAKLRANPSILANLETSKSVSKYAVDAVFSALQGKDIATYTSNTIIPVKTAVSRTKVSVSPKQKAVGATSLPKLKTTTKELTSLISLQNILNSRLYEQIKANMGTGSAKNVLNYQTGRFAHSVKVEKVSKSREGMITAFYSYMKYPYATFSAGGKQESPKSRDPKLLISKSIREILAQQVSNKLRAVNI